VAGTFSSCGGGDVKTSATWPISGCHYTAGLAASPEISVMSPGSPSSIWPSATGGAIGQIVAARQPGRLATLALTSCETHGNVPARAFKLPRCAPGTCWP
jgi:hypothetical protein